MMFKNSLRLQAANFSFVWKLLLYFFIFLAITAALVLPTVNTLISVFEQNNFLIQIQDFVNNYAFQGNILAFLREVYNLCLTFLECIKDIFVFNIGVGIYLAVLFFILVPFIFGLCELPVGEGLYGYMSSLAKINFSGSYIRKFGKSCYYQLVKIFVTLPFNIAIACVFFFSLQTVTLVGNIQFFAPLIFTVSVCFIIAIKLTVFSGWMPAMVVHNKNPFISLKKGCKAVGRRFWITLSSLFIIVLINFCFNALFGGFAILVSIPFGVLWVMVFNMVMYFGSQGMRYYVDQDTILTPKKFEEIDSFKKVKDLI